MFSVLALPHNHLVTSPNVLVSREGGVAEPLDAAADQLTVVIISRDHVIAVALTLL